ncbi:hypothetical protein FH587_04555 (plasmid) [Leptospira interrogans]|uniref:hypothetical protein n=1 Tax=Leptospira interrogans TaxID=173 RepID=UPI001F0792C3|nr:hypothetical protein [Leptospira interrogans]UML83086.1 hypothetical protein FH587_04395 [Leptospira interrogans]UML83116.1 hypothetical protein FH587_04555 [Leptospira interrogans]
MDERILRALATIKGQDWVYWFRKSDLVTNNKYIGNLRITKKLQEENFDNVSRTYYGKYGTAFIDRSSDYGDTFYGTIYFKLNSRQRYLKFDYAC